MRQRLLNIVAALGILGIVSMPVQSSAETDWDIAAGLMGKMSSLDTSGTETEGNEDLLVNNSIETNKGTHSVDVEYGSLFIEAAGRSGFAGLTAGFEYTPGSASLGSKSRSDTDTDADNLSGVSSTYTAKAEVENLVQFYLEPTIYFSDWFGVYAKGGVSQVDVNSLESISSGVNSSVYGNKTIWGATTGGGIRINAGYFLMKLEYTQTEFETVSLESDTGNRNRIVADIEEQTTAIKIGLQF